VNLKKLKVELRISEKNKHSKIEPKFCGKYQKSDWDSLCPKYYKSDLYGDFSKKMVVRVEPAQPEFCGEKKW